MRLDQALGLYIQQQRADGRSPHTVAQASRHLRLLDRWLGGQARVEHVTHEMLARFLGSDAARLRSDGRGKRPNSANALRSSLRTFFGYAHAAGITTTNPARLIRRARCSPPPPRALSREEQERLLAVLAQATGEAGERDRVMFEVMLATGIRVGSALALDVGDVDLARSELYLRSTKNGQPMVIYYNDRIALLFRRHIGERLSGPLFESRHGLRLSSRQVARRLWYWLHRAGCRRGSPHALRHTFAARVYGATHDLLAVQAALHHRSVVSSTVYAKIDGARMREILELIG